MSCQSVQKSLSAYLDQALSGKEAENVSQHLAGCQECALRSHELMELRRLLRNVPVVPVPQRLATQLRVLASREQARHGVSRWQSSLDWLRLAVDNLMRPVAIPLVGGIVTAIFGFSLITPTLTIKAASFDARTDVTLDRWAYTQGTMIDTPPFSFQGDELEIVLTIDENGGIIDYSCSKGKVSRQMMDNIGNSLLFSSFEPPTMFGKPIAGKIRVTFKKDGDFIVVRG